MTRHSAVGVHDNLTTGQSAVAVGSADNKTSCRVNIKLGILIYHLCRKDRIQNVFLDILVNLLLCHILTVLGRDNHSVQTCRLTVLIVLYSHLGLSVRTKVGQGAVLTNPGELPGQLVCQGNRIGHQLRSFVDCVAKHHTLVAGADGFDLVLAHQVLLCFQRLVYAHGDVGGLLVNGCNNRAVVGVKAVFSTVIADLAHGIANDFLNIYIALGGNLAHNEYQAGSGSGFAGYAAHGILLQQGVKNGVGNLVTNFVRMAFGYGF